MQLDLLLTGGTVVDPSQNLHEVRDLGIVGGTIADLSESVSYNAAKTIDVSGLIISPGPVSYTHLTLPTILLV